MTPSDKFTFTYSSFILFWLYLLLEVRVSSACNDLIMQLIMRRCSQTLVMTPWTWNGHINPSGSCQSWESHLYAHEPPWILSDIAIFSKLPCHCQSHRYLTIKQAIKLLWIASSGPGRLETSPFNSREKPACEFFHVRMFAAVLWSQMLSDAYNNI